LKRSNPAHVRETHKGDQMEANEQLKVLFRIANALERIAAVLEGKRPAAAVPVVTTPPPPPKPRPPRAAAVQAPPAPRPAPAPGMPLPLVPRMTKAQTAAAATLDASAQRELVGYLQACGYKTQGLKYNDESETYNLAKQIWASRTISFPFLKSLRHNLADRARFAFPYKSYGDMDRDRMRSLCDVLGKKDIIEYYEEPGAFVVTPKVGNAKQHYITGFWGEEIALYLIRKVMTEVSARQKMKYKIVQNVAMTRPGPDGKSQYRAEIDAVLLVNQTFYFFEVKTGNILKKYDEMARLLAGERHFYIMCCMDRAKGLDKLRETNRIKVFQLDALEQSLKTLLESSLR
jgi:hypothetical protein